MLEQNTQKKKKRKHQEHSEDSLSFGTLFSASLKGASLSLVLSVILSLAFCLIAYLTSDPTSLITPLSLLSLYISSFSSGLISVRACGHSSLICGLISGGIFMALLIFISFFFPSQLSSDHSFGISFLLHALVVVFSVFGGYAGQKKPKRAHKPKR